MNKKITVDTRTEWRIETKEEYTKRLKEKYKDIEIFIKNYVKLLNEIKFIEYYDGSNYYIEVNKSKFKRARMNLSEIMLEMEKWLEK